MSRNLQRQMNMLDIPTGDLGAFKREGGKIKLYDSGGGGGQPSETTQTADLPDWAKPYAKDTLAKGAALTDINKNPYQVYGGERIAGFQPMQQQAFDTAANMQPSAQLGLGTGLAGAAGLGALGTNYEAGRFSGGQFGNRQAAQYMSPYIEQAMQPQLREAERASQIQGAQQQAQAVGAGAFGGSRDALMRAERERNLGMLQGDIRSKGYQTAYEQAANQYNQDMARRMQAQQLGEQSRQYGAGLGMQGLQTALQSAGQLGQLGQTQYGQQMGINQLQAQYGQQQQQQAQRPLDVAYQDFLNQQNYPYKQLGFMSDMIRGLPLGQKSTSTVYEGTGSTMGQLAGLGMGAYGLSKMFADGGSVTDVNNVENILEKLSDQQLQQAKEAALNRRDAEQAQMIDAEIARRNAVRQPNPESFGGIAPALPEQFADNMEQNMATGGIVAFADRGAVKEMPEKATSPIGDLLESIGVTGGLNALRESYYKSREQEKRMDAAENMYPGLSESLRPTERKRRTEAGNRLFAGPQDVTSMTPEEIEAANARVMAGSTKPQPPATSTAGAGRGTYQGYVPAQDIKSSGKSEKPSVGLGDVTAASKPSKTEVKSAVAQFAEQNKLGAEQKEDLMTTALKIREELGKQNQPILDKLNAAIEAQKPDEQAIKDKGLAQALTQFGFGLAERASKPGARFLESASGAAPVLGAVAAKTDELLQSRKDNYTKLQLDQAKYEVALAKGDMQTAAVLAGQIRQANQQDKALQFQIAKAQDDLQMEKAKLAQQGAYQNQMASRYETVGSLTRDIMKNEGLPYDKALEKAGNIMKGGIPAGLRGDTSTKIALAKELDAIEKNYPAMLRSGDSKMAQENRRAYEAAINRVYSIYGGSPAEGPSGRSALPSGVTVTEVGR
jgi:hypothetical protein